MPKTEVRDAIVAYLTPPASDIPYLGTVYPALPKVGNESDLFNFTPPGNGVGAVIYVFFEDQAETRIALGGPNNGRKLRPYSLSMLLIFKSNLNEAADGQVAFDSFIDGFTARIEADRNAGDPSVVFSWGEGGMNGGPDLRIAYTVPKVVADSAGVMLFQAVARVTVLEILQT